MFKARTIALSGLFIAAATVHAGSANYDCSLKGFDQTPPPAMTNSKSNVQSFDWGSDVDKIDGNRGWLFWHYLRNRAGNKPLWLTWKAAGLRTSGEMPLPGGGTVCKQTQVFFELDEPPNIKISVDNDAPIRYGAQRERQDASIYVPVPPIVRPDVQEPTSIKSWLMHLVGTYAGRDGQTHGVNLRVATSHADHVYRLNITAAPENITVGIAGLSRSLTADQLTDLTETLRKQTRGGVGTGSLPSNAATALFPSAMPDTGDFLFLKNINEVNAEFASAPGEIPVMSPATVVVLDNDRRPLFAVAMALLLPRRR